MFRTIVLHIEFPEKEFKKIPSVFEGDFSLRHGVGESFFYLGEVISGYWETLAKVVMALEIRKDETPVWYLRSIVKNAQREEIVVMKNSDLICVGGRLTRIENLDEASDKDIVISLEALITPRKVAH